MPEQVERHASYIPAQPAMLVLGDRRIVIDEWPLARTVEERLAVEVTQPSPDLMVIEPKKRTATFRAVQGIGIVLGGCLPAAVAMALEVPAWLAILGGLLMLAFPVLMVRAQLEDLRWIRFDRKAGQLFIERRLGFRRRPRIDRTLPLPSIHAVQLLFNGRHSVTEPQGAGERQTISSREFCGYELNLIVDDPKAPRLHLFSLADWQWLRRTGQTLADFLGVPLIDKLYHGE